MPANRTVLRILVWIRDVFRIEGPLDDVAVLDLVRNDIEFRGAKAWILVAAIFIASLGLNTNSTAVIIGAMLISPLMGPIVGIGTALGRWDISLLTRSARNLGVAVGISLLTSTIYFLLTPLGDAQSELIARTTPTLLDALIAVFGGLAGAVAVVRQDKSNVVPGVAIATALMPPLCTAGYGLAHLDPAFFFGAFYMFFVNGVCISAATYVVFRAAGMHKQGITDPVRERRVRTIVMAVVVVTLVPSVVIGYHIVRQSIFEQRTDRLAREVRARYPSASVLITDRQFGGDTSSLEIAIVGDELSANDKRVVDSLRVDFGLGTTRMLIRQAGEVSRLDRRPDVSSSRLLDLYSKTEVALAEKNRQIDSLDAIVRRSRAATTTVREAVAEATALFDDVQAISIAPGVVRWSTDGSSDTTAIATVTWKRPPSRKVEASVQAWLRIRFRDSTLIVH